MGLVASRPANAGSPAAGRTRRARARRDDLLPGADAPGGDVRYLGTPGAQSPPRAAGQGLGHGRAQSRAGCGAQIQPLPPGDGQAAARLRLPRGVSGSRLPERRFRMRTRIRKSRTGQPELWCRQPERRFRRIKRKNPKNEVKRHPPLPPQGGEFRSPTRRCFAVAGNRARPGAGGGWERLGQRSEAGTWAAQGYRPGPRPPGLAARQQHTTTKAR